MKKCKECGQELPKEKQGVKIVSRYGLNKVLFQSTKTTLKEAVIEAVSKGANLRYANLRYADLSGAKTEMCRVNFTPEEYDQAKQFIEGLKL